MWHGSNDELWVQEVTNVNNLRITDDCRQSYGSQYVNVKSFGFESIIYQSKYQQDNRLTIIKRLSLFLFFSIKYLLTTNFS